MYFKCLTLIACRPIYTLQKSVIYISNCWGEIVVWSATRVGYIFKSTSSLIIVDIIVIWKMFIFMKKMLNIKIKWMCSLQKIISTLISSFLELSCHGITWHLKNRSFYFTLTKKMKSLTLHWWLFVCMIQYFDRQLFHVFSITTSLLLIA